ncbi:ABC transporter ATP-binding protein [Globicatella sanguinis]|uniref:ABC transporter ATP-binding protein n=1 Tax=Globicatella sanguinis TaxID=13076 RepID=UPI002542AFE0|nr:ABC transporter ATP-binding protein [Globicatella sanguinis]MDK7631100.1 ABC transporter ATP-binding protein [Globicatella sanguinis]WIK66120.1 ABC transporter ATP-binding protein [Globicatella sanguinis]WKT55525.1 ABC transporter ATP-binding protein [Globicatella sanguinis]
MNEPILSVKNLQISFKTFAGEVQAIRGVSFDLHKGETLAIVGESGSGKTVTTRSIMGLLSKNAIIKSGEVIFNGENLLQYKERQMRDIRGTQIAMIFQDPMTSLNPTLTIGQQIMEILTKQRGMSKSEAIEETIELLTLCGIRDPEARLKQYPHQFSGGQRQRIVIAIALAGDPEILIADEPTTALDVTIQAQIIELLEEIQRQKDMSIIFITHDLGVVANVADRVAVMYAGKIVEIGGVDDIYYHPQHPYTWGLLSAMPTPDQKGELYAIPGTPPDLLNPPKGDAFALRNEYALAIDFEKEPPMFQVCDTHYAATWLLHPQAPEVTPPQNILDRYEHYRCECQQGGRQS